LLLGAREDEIATQVSRLFEFGALREDAKRQILREVAHLEFSGRLEWRGEHLVVVAGVGS
jgi:hypothetical protein